MKAEQINEGMTVEKKDLAQLSHIKERTKNKEAIAKYVLGNVNNKTYLSVSFVNAAHRQRTDDRAEQTPKIIHRGLGQGDLAHSLLPNSDEGAGFSAK
jgi:ATP-dependent protease Clp ATPase subunit